MAVRIPDYKSFAESQLSGVIRNHARRDKIHVAVSQLASSAVYASGHDDGLPVNDVVGMFVRGEGPSVARRQVVQQLDPRSAGSAQCSDAQMRAKYVVQVLLLGAVVLALAGHMHTKEVAVELDAGVGVPDDDRGVINTEEQFVRGAVPLLRAFVGRKMEDFYRMLDLDP